MRFSVPTGIIGALLLATSTSVPATSEESHWSGSLAGGPVVVQVPTFGLGTDDGEFIALASFGRRFDPVWGAGVEAGYIRFGRYFNGAMTDVSLSQSPSTSFDSYDLTLYARCHPKVGGHPYLVAGTGAYAVNGYFPDADPNQFSRQVKPGLMVGAGIHGILLPALGFELRWLKIYEGAGPSRRPTKDVLNILFSLTKE